MALVVCGRVWRFVFAAKHLAAGRAPDADCAVRCHSGACGVDGDWRRRRPGVGRFGRRQFAAALSCILGSAWRLGGHRIDLAGRRAGGCRVGGPGGRVAAIPRRERNHQQLVAQLPRHRALQACGGRAAARSGQLEQALHLAPARWPAHWQHARLRRALGFGVWRGAVHLGGGVALAHHARICHPRRGRKCARRALGGFAGKSAHHHGLRSGWRMRRSGGRARGGRRAHQRQCFAHRRPGLCGHFGELCGAPPSAGHHSRGDFVWWFWRCR